MSERELGQGNEKLKLMNPRQTNWLIGLGILTVIVVNAAIVFVVIPEISRRLSPFYNQDLYSDGYDQLASNLAAGNGYRFYPGTAETLMREPGYPMFLAGIILVFGKNLTAVKLTNMCLALGAAWVMTRIARKLSCSPALILVPSVLFLLHPGTLIAESRGGIEIPFTFLILLFMLTLYRAIESNRWWDYALSGGLLGFTVLVRSTPILFPFFLLAYLLVVQRQRSSQLVVWRNVVLMIIAMFVVLSPWIIRNYLLTKRFVPTASVLGVSAQAGQYICMHRADGKPWVLLDREAAIERGRLARVLGYHFKEDDPYYQVFYSSVDEVNFSRYLLSRVLRVYEQSPLLCVKCMTSNLFNFWCAGKMWLSTGLSLAVQLPYLILGIAGATLSVKNGHSRVIGPMVLFIMYIVAVYIPILAQARYSVPLVPFLSILASVALMAGTVKGGGAMCVTADGGAFSVVRPVRHGDGK
jgi:4-amino-4-deoxy-L-arabinose transferase-like glycosyltransferase